MAYLGGVALSTCSQFSATISSLCWVASPSFRLPDHAGGSAERPTYRSPAARSCLRPNRAFRAGYARPASRQHSSFHLCK
jgi:hypothetical protein